MVCRRPEEARLPKGPEHHFHLAGHVHLHHQRFIRNARRPADLEGRHDRHPEQGPDALLHEEIERGLGRGAHLDSARPQDAESLRQRQHPLLRAAAAVGLDADTRPEAFAGLEQLPGGDAGHSGSHEEDIDGVGRGDQAVRQAVPRREGDGAPRPEGGGHEVREEGRNHLIR